MASDVRISALARSLTVAAALLVLAAGGAVSAGAQQVIDNLTPVLTLSARGITVTHHASNLRAGTDYDTHRWEARQLILFADGTLRAVDSYNELEDHGPAYASAVDGRGTESTWKALLAALAAADLPAQTGNCSHPFVVYLGQADDYTLVATHDHDYDLVWLAAAPDEVAAVHLTSQAPECPTPLNLVISTILQYEQEVLALNPHTTAGS